MKKSVVIAEFMDAPAVASLARSFEVLYDPTLVDDTPRLMEQARQADALIVRNRTQVRGDLLRDMARVRVVGRLGVGLDNIDVAGCEARGIKVIPATGANALAVAEYVIGTVMLLLRGAYQSQAEVAAGQWPRARMSSGRETAGKTLGLIGFGSIGQLTGRLARAVGMEVVAYDPAFAPSAAEFAREGVQRLELDALLACADAVSLHVPLTPQTTHLLSAARIAAMKPGAVVVNTSRGGIVDEAALAHALRAGTLGGAALDVFQQEPLPDGSVWKDCPNVVLTPHIAGVTAEANERVSSLIAREVARFLEGQHANA